ncbi:MAG: hypothetical protein GX354_09745, partial [Firmicutes bacterium]|nr:hypothetical protein [Bacillota bacterium]
MLQRKCRESNKWGSLNWSLVLMVVALALLSTSGSVLAAEVSASEESIGLANDAAFEVELANISSLQDILQVAMVNNPSIQIANWELQEALAGRSEVSVALKPQFTIAGQHKVENVANSTALSQLELYELDDRFSTTIGSLTYYQQLRPNAQLKGLTKQAEIGSEIAVLRKEQATKDAILAAQSSYYDVLRAYSGLQLAR